MCLGWFNTASRGLSRLLYRDDRDRAMLSTVRVHISSARGARHDGAQKTGWTAGQTLRGSYLYDEGVEIDGSNSPQRPLLLRIWALLRDCLSPPRHGDESAARANVTPTLSLTVRLSNAYNWGVRARRDGNIWLGHAKYLALPPDGRFVTLFCVRTRVTKPNTKAPRALINSERQNFSNVVRLVLLDYSLLRSYSENTASQAMSRRFMAAKPGVCTPIPVLITCI